MREPDAPIPATPEAIAPTSNDPDIAELAQRIGQNVRPNIVQSIRAYNPHELQAVAQYWGQHFLYAQLQDATTKQRILEEIGKQLMLPGYFGRNYDALYDCLTDTILSSGKQTGFVVVLEHIPISIKFDKEMREQLLDIFRDTADFWAERKIPFRCFYSFY